jgi:hypothetical protein
MVSLVVIRGYVGIRDVTVEGKISWLSESHVRSSAHGRLLHNPEPTGATSAAQGGFLIGFGKWSARVILPAKRAARRRKTFA